jgi:hypothetical protein
MELHFVPHAGCRDEHTSEANVLERLEWEIDNFGRITLGGKTAMSPGGSDVDVLVYNALRRSMVNIRTISLFYN